MTYLVLVLLPAGAAWAAMPQVTVRSTGPVDEDLAAELASAVIQVALDVEGVDEELERYLADIGQQAFELGGVALDGRSLKPIVEPEPESAGRALDPGPVWEHLPGVGMTALASGAVVDANLVIAQLEDGVAGVGERTQYEPDVDLNAPGGFAIVERAMGEIGSHAGRFVLACATVGAVGAALGSFDPWVAGTIPLFLGGVLVPLALAPRMTRGSRHAAIMLILSSAVIAAAGVSSSRSGGVGALGSLVLPFAYAIPVSVWLGGSLRRGVEVTVEMLRSRAPSILCAWLLCVIFPIEIIVLIVLAAMPGTLHDVNPHVGAAIFDVAAAVSIAYPTALAMVASEWFAVDALKDGSEF